MENKKTIEAIRDFILTAEKSIKNAKKLLKDVLEDNNLSLDSEIDLSTMGLTNYNSDNLKIIEGVFIGEEMLGSKGEKYIIPANYASKSKLVQGDKLKLTIEPNGKMTYKQILPIERETKVGLLTKEGQKYQVVADSKAYNVLTASITHFKGEIGDQVTIIVPKGKDANFAAVDAILPKNI